MVLVFLFMKLLSLFSKPAKPNNDMTAVFIGRNNAHLSYGMTGTAIWWVGKGQYAFWPDGGLLNVKPNDQQHLYLPGHDLLFPNHQRVDKMDPRYSK